MTKVYYIFYNNEFVTSLSVTGRNESDCENKGFEYADTTLTPKHSDYHPELVELRQSKSPRKKVLGMD